MLTKITKDTELLMATEDPKRLEEQLCELLPIYRTIGLKVQAVGDLLKTRVPYIPGNTNHLGTMHAGVTWMAGEVLGGLAYFGHSEELGEAWVTVKKVDIEFKRPVKTAITALANFPAEERKRIATELKNKDRSRFTLEIEVVDDEQQICAIATGHYVLGRD